MKGNHSSNIPTVEDPIPNNAMKIGIITNVAFPFSTFMSHTTSLSKAPLLVMKPTDANAMKTKNITPVASFIPLNRD